MSNAYLSDPDPELVQALAGFSKPPDAQPDLHTLRESMNLLAIGYRDQFKPRGPHESAYRLEERQITVRDGNINVRCLIPSTGNQETFPLLVWFHGGGFAVGTAELDEPLLKVWCTELQIVVVSVHYRLSPEHPYPIPWNDCIDATKWALENASDLSASPAKGFLVGGLSAGGNLAANVARLARDDPQFAKTPITGQLLQMATVLHPYETYEEYRSELTSVEQNKVAPFLTAEDALRFARWTAAPTGVASEGEPCWSVILRQNRAGLAPAYVQVAGWDILRDEGILYEKLLREAGVPTKIDIYPGLPHGWFYGLPNLQASQKQYKDSLDGLRWLLAKK